MTQCATVRREAGFGLIEILAAVLVLAIGVIGFAALQVRAVQASSDSYARTQAMSIAQDLAERVRANGGEMATYLNAATWPTTAITEAPDGCMVGNCTTAEMAAFDAMSVRYNAQTLLPAGLVRMEACQASVRNCIYVAWDGLQPTAGASAGPDGDCVSDTGVYLAPPTGQPARSCVMLEVQ